MVTAVKWQTIVRYTSVRNSAEWGSDSLKVDENSKTADGEPAAEQAKFQDFFRESILDVIKNIFGEGGTKAIFFHLRLKQFDYQSAEFSGRLHVIFGKEGALTLEKIIVKELYRRVRLPYEETIDFDFEERVKLAEQVVLGAAAGRERGRR